jgi:hypothetical protein
LIDDLEFVAHTIQRSIDLVARGTALEFAVDFVACKVHPQVILFAGRCGQVDAHKVANVAEFAVAGDVVAVFGEVGVGKRFCDGECGSAGVGTGGRWRGLGTYA